MIRVVLVAPSPALRAGLRSLLSSDNEIKIVDERKDWNDSRQEEQNEADVVITTSASFAAYSDEELDEPPLVAILFLQDEPFNIKLMMSSSRVWGILPLETSGDELCAAIHALSEGLIVGTPQLLFSPSEEEPAARGPLTDREA